MKKAGDLLNLYFDEIQKSEAEQYSHFQNSWEKIAGTKIGTNSKIKDVIDGKLIIEIDHPGLKQLIMLKEKYIIRSIKKEFPELNILKIKFYFKNNSTITKKNTEININTEYKSVPKSDIDVNFSDLLKKMSKRSEE